MENKRNFHFERFSISHLTFTPRNISGELQYGVSVNPEYNEDNEQQLKLAIGVKLRDSENEDVFFDGIISGIFILEEDFGEFDIQLPSERLMIEMVLDEFEHLIYELSGRSFDKPMVIRFDVDELIKNLSKIVNDKKSLGQ